ncbi:MAG: glycosyl transferase family 4 [Candidatus Diapherotrites archaeon]|uniref:Glycosyl transferase family 4 n=1 Tax=Candidatus Iainarchaeum sp. TaxID=3101447 RepID=A0A7J4JXQ2_9ARCH|nr:MAG: UDP-N-acetylglucosamine-dolichyl-phosphate N-acetylglucosaminephosphotransferase [archaeon GW2011_AR21]MBS3057905.1 glycosyl transferase family 4 [Candidatus Diapherotrites archaeon]HIH21459.1 glycosyl transferase family 4 [Candidatus Diapherotrites archaeon]
MAILPVAIGLMAVSALVVFWITPRLIKHLKARGLVGKDMNKLGRPEVAEMGGIAVLLGFIAAMLVSIFFHSYLKTPEGLSLVSILGAFLTVAVIGLIGVIDDLIGWKKGIRQWQHALFPLFAALPLMALSIGQTTMGIPLLGDVELGILYSLIIIPIGITCAANASNMLAGLNGLEAGLGAIISATILAIALLSGKTEAAIITASLLGALLAFLYFNWHPARIFPGDSLTLAIGAAVASAVIVGDLEKYGVMLFGLYFIELAIKAKHKFQSQCFGIPQKDGTLKADPRGGSLTQWIMRRGRFTEKQVVIILLAIQAIIALIVLAAFLTNPRGS